MVWEFSGPSQPDPGTHFLKGFHLFGTLILKFSPGGTGKLGGREPPAPGDFFELLAGGENEGGHFLFLEGHPGHIPELSPPSSSLSLS